MQQIHPITFSVGQISPSAMPCHFQYSLVDLVKHEDREAVCEDVTCSAIVEDQ